MHGKDTRHIQRRVGKSGRTRWRKIHRMGVVQWQSTVLEGGSRKVRSQGFAESCNFVLIMSERPGMEKL